MLIKGDDNHDQVLIAVKNGNSTQFLYITSNLILKAKIKLTAPKRNLQLGQAKGSAKGHSEQDYTTSDHHSSPNRQKIRKISLNL